MALLYAAKHKLDKFNIYLDEAGATDVEELVTVCRKLKRDGKLDFVIVDYLQLLTTTKDLPTVLMKYLRFLANSN